MSDGHYNHRGRPALLVTLLLVVAATVASGCGRTTTTPPDAADVPASLQDPLADGRVRIGLVTDQGGLNDRSFNALAYKGLQAAEERWDIEVNVFESRSASDYERNLTSFARAGFDLVIGVGFLMADPVRSTAAQFPGTRFAIIDFSYAPEHIPNVRGILFAEHEAGYLAGVLAGLVERDSALPGLNDAMVVSSIGGQAIPPVNKYIAGYQAGVKSVCTECTTVNTYSQDFIQQNLCKEQAISHIGRGSDIIFQVAGGCGLGALGAAEERGVWGIGVDADQAYLGDHILTSAMKNVDVAVEEMVGRIVDKSWVGGADSVYGIAEDGVGLGEVADGAQRFMGQVDKARADIVAGKLEIPQEVQQ